MIPSLPRWKQRFIQRRGEESKLKYSGEGRGGGRHRTNISFLGHRSLGSEESLKPILVDGGCGGAGHRKDLHASHTLADWW